MNAIRPSNSTIELILQLLPAAFLAILFLQSGFDKVIDRKGNLDFLTGHFSKTPVRGMVGPMLISITVLEIATGVLCALGFLQLVFAQVSVLAFWGAVLAAVTLLGLFFGQRLAKDYAGAAGLVPYFLLALAAIHLEH
jgi:uncharacterized membrane protein YphA (DoxX/SURF4 family)